jgi:hypothetical protein
MDSALGRSPAESFIRIIRTSVLGAGVAVEEGAWDSEEAGCAVTDAKRKQENSVDRGARELKFIQVFAEASQNPIACPMIE